MGEPTKWNGFEFDSSVRAGCCPDFVSKNRQPGTSTIQARAPLGVKEGDAVTIKNDDTGWKVYDLSEEVERDVIDELQQDNQALRTANMELAEMVVRQKITISAMEQTIVEQEELHISASKFNDQLNEIIAGLRKDLESFTGRVWQTVWTPAKNNLESGQALPIYFTSLREIHHATNLYPGDVLMVGRELKDDE